MQKNVFHSLFISPDGDMTKTTLQVRLIDDQELWISESGKEYQLQHS